MYERRSDTFPVCDVNSDLWRRLVLRVWTEFEGKGNVDNDALLSPMTTVLISSSDFDVSIIHAKAPALKAPLQRLACFLFTRRGCELLQVTCASDFSRPISGIVMANLIYFRTLEVICRRSQGSHNRLELIRSNKILVFAHTKDQAWKVCVTQTTSISCRWSSGTTCSALRSR